MVEAACDKKEPNISTRYEEWFEDLSNGQQSARFFVTDQGHVSFGPPAVEVKDKVYVSLGCHVPIVLRPMLIHGAPEQHQVMGLSYIHGLMEGQGLLGPLPKPWTMVVEEFQPIEVAFYNSETEDITIDDPRLGALPEEWEEVEIEDETQSLHALRHYRHRDLGEVIDPDPRKLPDALRARGVKLKTVISV
jgi:hypothetical protein